VADFALKLNNTLRIDAFPLIFKAFKTMIQMICNDKKDNCFGTRVSTN
jgi:hypothetical protein